MEYIDGDIHETANSLRLRVYACLNLDTKEIFNFEVFEGEREATKDLEDFNSTLYERLKEKIRDHLIERSKEDGAQL